MYHSKIAGWTVGPIENRVMLGPARNCVRSLIKMRHGAVGSGDRSTIFCGFSGNHNCQETAPVEPRSAFIKNEIDEDKT